LLHAIPVVRDALTLSVDRQKAMGYKNSPFYNNINPSPCVYRVDDRLLSRSIMIDKFLTGPSISEKHEMIQSCKDTPLNDTDKNNIKSRRRL